MRRFSECPFWLCHKIKNRHWATAACQRPLRAPRLWRLIVCTENLNPHIVMMESAEQRM